MDRTFNMIKFLSAFMYMLINGIFGAIVIGGPTAFIYFTLGFMGVPQIVINIASVFTCLMFIPVFVSICTLIIQNSPKNKLKYNREQIEMLKQELANYGNSQSTTE